MPDTQKDGRQTLGFVTPTRTYSNAQGIFMHPASGRVADRLARHYDRVLLCSRVMYGPPPSATEIPLAATNIEVVAEPPWRTTMDALPHIVGIVRAYFQTCRRSDVLFVRGMCPYIAALYLFALMYRRPVCHWIVGDPIAILKTSSRGNRYTDALALLYAIQNRIVTRAGRWLTGGSFICNGRELALRYASARTITAVSSTIDDHEFSVRADTCQGKTIRILFVGYLRPEKGIEYLLQAVSRLDAVPSWELHLVGSSEFPTYVEKLQRIVADLDIGDRVHWHGHVPYGESLFEQMRNADMLVLPTLSEGTPHVLVEARANSLPCISTRVGGVPSTVTHGYDGLLVAPKDSLALAHAIQLIIDDPALRRRLIHNGIVMARLQTLDRFVELVHREMESGFEPGLANAAQV